MAGGQRHLHAQGRGRAIPLLSQGSRLKPIILASASPRRRILLRRLKIPFKIIPSRVSEKTRETNPRRLVLKLALRKAKDVARRYPEAVVLGADTIVVCRREIIGKPKDHADALRILDLLNGVWQEVYTGIAVVWAGGKAWRSRAVKSRVLARTLSPARLHRLAGKHHDKAGAYAVQDRNDPFISRIEGDYTNVVGLPLKATRSLLKKAPGL